MKMNKTDAIALIRSILSSTKTTYSVSNLNKAFRNETGIDIPLFGYDNISDFLNSIPQTVKLTGIYPIQHVSLISNEKSAHIVTLVQQQKCRMQQRGISSAKNDFRKTKMDARFTEQLHHKGSGKGNPSGFTEQNKEDQSFSFRYLFLKNGLCYFERVPPIDLELHASIGKYIEVHLCEILSPHKFFFQLRKFKKSIGKFMNDLQIFYAMHEEIPNITASLIKPEQICAVFHEIHSEAKWYRAEIQEIVSESHVIVHFVDFGGSAKVLKENLKFLHRNFISFPKQACLGFLANIKPAKINSEWSPFAVKRFRHLAFQKDLVAGVVYMNTKMCCLGVALSFTRGKEIHINDTLVKEGYAQFEMDVSRDHFNVDFNENYRSKSKIYIDKRQFFNKKTCCNKKLTKETPISVHQESISSETQIPVFYAPNIYNTNAKLKKMFSTHQNNT